MADTTETRPGKFTALELDQAWNRLVVHLAEQGARIIHHTPTSIVAVRVVQRRASFLAMIVFFGFGFFPGVYYAWWASNADEHGVTITLVPADDGTVMHADGTPEGLRLAHWVTDLVVVTT